MSATSAVSIATSDPAVPMAIPTEAAASAGVVDAVSHHGDVAVSFHEAQHQQDPGDDGPPHLAGVPQPGPGGVAYRRGGRARGCRRVGRGDGCGQSHIPCPAMEKHRVLVVDDEPGLRRMVTSYLSSDGFDVVEAADGDEGVRLFRELRPNLVLLDVVMPGLDGLEVLRTIRSESETPVIMLTARAEEVDRVVGLTVGADDYITKPFSPRELSARIKAVLRRWKASASVAETSDVLRFEGLRVDVGRRELLRDGEPVELSALEFDLLAALASTPGRVFTRGQLLERVWGWDYFGSDRVVDVHISSLRRKLEDQAGSPRFIATVRGVGYKFVARPA